MMLAVSGAETSQTVTQTVTAASHVATAARAACAPARTARRRSRPWGPFQATANVSPQSAASSRNASPSAGAGGSPLRLLPRPGHRQLLGHPAAVAGPASTALLGGSVSE